MNKAGNRIRILRKEKNLSLERLSELTGISRSALSRYENYKADINGDNLIALAKFFKVTSDYILGLTDY